VTKETVSEIWRIFLGRERIGNQLWFAGIIAGLETSPPAANSDWMAKEVSDRTPRERTCDGVQSYRAYPI